MLILTWIVLTKLIFKLPASLGISKSAIKQDLIRLGIMHFEEKVIAIVLTLTGALWLFRSNIEFGSFTIPGWSQLMPFPKFLDDSTVAISMAFLLFLIPSKTKGTQIAEIKLFTKVPWDIIILFGGGFALAMGFEVSGLSRSIGELFAGINFNNPLILIVIICTILTFLTELTSNTATTYTVLPILASISIGIGINPIILMLPATLSASFAFMLPVATPPNAIVFSAGYLNIKDMVRAGFVLNLVGIIVITFVLYFISFPILGIKF